MLKKGDPCYVRLANGTINKAIYEQPAADGKWHLVIKWHWVIIGDTEYLASDSIDGDYECRFVCMTGMNKGEDNEAH